MELANSLSSSLNRSIARYPPEYSESRSSISSTKLSASGSLALWMSQVAGTNQSSNSESEIWPWSQSARCEWISAALGMARHQSPNNIVVHLDAPALCKLFNEGGFLEKVESGELRMIVKKTRITQMTHIRNWVPGTESQEIHLLDTDDNVIVKAHRFLKPDGKLAASGMLDPKRIFIEGKIYGLKGPESENVPG